MSAPSPLRKCPACTAERIETSFVGSVCNFCHEAGRAPPAEPDERVSRGLKRRKQTKQEPETAPPAFVPTPAQTAGLTPEGAYIPPQFDSAAAHASPQAELASRTLSRRRLLPFIKRFRPKYDAGWVHHDICRRLERFVEDVAAGREPRLLLMCPPRSGKSEIASRHFPPWVLGKYPDWEIIAASHTTSLSMSFSRYIRDLLRDQAYQVVFPEAVLDPSSQSVENWNLTAGGGYLAAGVGSAITGRGAHILLLDDLVKDIEAADSAGQRESTWEWYISTAHSRLAPGGGVLGLMTWWHEDDWAGRIQQVMKKHEDDEMGGEVFEIVRYPAINEHGDEYILEDDSIAEIPPGAPVPEGAVMTRPHNTALHPARYSTAAVLRKKANYIAAGMKRMWDALYQQNPTPDEGIYFGKNMFRHYVHQPVTHGRFVYQAWDFAITTGEQNDWTVGTTLLQDEYDNLYVLDVLRFRSDDGIEIVESILDYQQQWGAQLLGFEDGQIWKALASQFKKRCEERQIYPSYELLTPLTDKMVRASPLRGRMQLGKVYFPNNAPWFSTLQTELLRFPGGKHDDQVDSLAWCVRLTLSRAAPKLPQPKPLPSWKDKLKKLETRGGAMAA